MNKTIFLPNAEQAGELIELAWQEFRKDAEANGFPFSNDENAEAAKELFICGYCYGHNDCLGIIKGQLEAMDMAVNLGNSHE